MSDKREAGSGKREVALARKMTTEDKEITEGKKEWRLRRDFLRSAACGLRSVFDHKEYPQSTSYTQP